MRAPYSHRGEPAPGHGDLAAVAHLYLPGPRRTILVVTCLPDGSSYRREYTKRPGETDEQAVERLAPAVMAEADRRIDAS